ncbi:glycoside hydrolase family 31 protein [Mesorhizobium sp. 1M-11]|uniref:glycoside hydrolase family 31 protein n=1 Tax=Mesorhizobium sp. 1M-11 TaxID=1529006 RepID=UPI000A7963A8|nr:glycoside hydrolase family 31 protein [Mesorhizobium sp. 1M-11]
MSEAMGRATFPVDAVYRPIGLGWRAAGGSWTSAAFERGGELSVSTTRRGDSWHIVATHPHAEAMEIVFALPKAFQAFGGGERFETLNLRGQSVRYYLENFGLGNGTYLPSPWIATSLGYAVYLPGEAAAVFHVAAPFDPNVLRIQVEGNRLEIEIDLGTLDQLYLALIERIGPPTMPEDSFFGLWKAGDWRIENAETVAADIAGYRNLSLPMAIKLIDAYWASEVHSFEFDTAKYPDAWDMVARMAADGTDIYLWLCPWVVVGTKSYTYASAKGYTIRDAEGTAITRRPGANPNIVAALIDFSNPEASDWWSENLRRLLKRGIKGFKADFGEQLPEHALLHSGETGGQAHNAFVRYYLEATIAAFDGRTPAIISRSGSPRIRAPIWSGDQTSDFCPKTGLSSAVRAAQSAAFAGWSFVGSDLGGYFGTPTPQVFARWAQFSCFTPLMMLHGLGCREPWDMDATSVAVYDDYARLHLSLLPVFQRHGHTAANGGLPLLRMMPLSFPEVDWSSINDWDQQYMLGDDILVAPVAFYGNTRAVYLPEGEWFDVLSGTYVDGSTWRIHDVPLDRMPIFIRKGARLVLARDAQARRAVEVVFAEDASKASRGQDGWSVEAVGIVKGTSKGVASEPELAVFSKWFGAEIEWMSVMT